MKLKFKLMAILITLGVVSSGFAAWNFNDTSHQDVDVDLGVDDPAPSKIELVPGVGVTNNMELTVGQSINISAQILDEYNQVMTSKPTGTLTNPATATYVDGVLSATAVDNNGSLVFASTGLANVSFNFTIIAAPPSEHTVTFDTDGGGTIAPVQVAHEGAVTRPDDPSKVGHSFVNWYNGESVYDFATPVITDLTLTAHWNINQYNVTFETNGGSTIEPVQVPHGSSVTKPTDPTRIGYIFEAWELAGSTYDFSSTVTNHITLIAKWEQAADYVFDFTSMTGGSAITSIDDYLTSNNLEQLNITLTSANAEAGKSVRFGTGSVKGSLKIETVAKVYGLSMIVKHWDNVNERKAIDVIDNTNENTQALAITDNYVRYFIDFENGTNDILISAQIASNNRFHIQELVLMVNPPVPPADLASIDISSASGFATVEENQTLQLSALVKDVDGVTVEYAKVTWESLNATVAQINSSGLVTALTPGNAMIEVTASRKTSKINFQYALTVTARPAPAPNKITFVGHAGEESPAKTVALASGTTVLETRVFDQYNNEMTGVDLVWVSSNTAVATVSNGTVSLVSEGTTTITVSVNGDATVYADFALTIEAAAPVIEKTVTLAHPNGGGTSNLSDDNEATKLGLDADIFDVRGIQGSAGSNVGLNNAGNIRLYFHADGGSTLAVSIDPKFVIKELEFNFGGTVANAKILVGGVEKHNGALTSNSSMSFVDLEVTNFSIQNVNSSNTQIHINSIKITYATAGPAREFANLDSISIQDPASKLTFRVGDTFNHDGLSVLAKDDSEPAVTKTLTTEFTTDLDGTTFVVSDIGSKTVTISYTEGGITKNTSYVIQVLPKQTGGTATYVLSSKNTLTKSGVTPDGSSATIVETYSTSKQMTSGNSQTVTLTNYGNVKITKITLSMRSNKSAGAGSFTYSLDGGSTWINIVTGSNFNNSNWYGNWSESYVNVVKTVNINVTSSIIFKISATANSLYCQSYAFQWE